MRTPFKFWKRLTGPALLALAAVLFTSDIASAQRRGGGGGRGWGGGTAVRVGPGGVGVRSGGVAVGVGYGGYGRYGYGGYGGYRGWYGPGFYGGGYYGGVPYTSGYYSAPEVITVPSSGVVAAGAASTPSSNDSAMLVTDVSAGPAREAGIQRGDVILSVDGKRTHNFDELRAALTSNQNPVNIDVYSPTTNQRANRSVNVNSGTIGVSVIEAPVALQ